MDTVPVEQVVTFETALKRMHETGEEFCVSCLKGVGFSARMHVEHPIRFQAGARYVEGGGQLCTTCGPVHSTILGYPEH